MSDAGRHAEIARRYDRKRDVEKVSVGALRVTQLQRLFVDRYGRQLPDDDAGKDDAFVMAHALAWRPNAQRRIPAWLSLNIRPPGSGQGHARIFKNRPRGGRATTLKSPSGAQ